MATLRSRITTLAALALLLVAASLPLARAAGPDLDSRRIPAEVRGPLVYDGAAKLFYGFGIERDDAGDLVRVAFEVDPQTLRYRRIYVFEPGEYLGATLAPDGSLFGARYALPGSIFRLVRVGPNDWRYETVHDFTSDEGSFASGQLVFAAAGDVGYGRTECGSGSGACRGIVYRIRKRKAGWAFSVIHRFTDETGFDSEGPMALVNGDLYGTVAFGGPTDRSAGATFRLSPKADPDKPWTFTSLHGFAFGGPKYLTRTRSPRGLAAHDGFLYGVASGGRGQSGVVYRVRTTGADFEILKTFFGATPDDPARPPDGAFPNAELAIGRDGEIYGSTSLGGDPKCAKPSGCGTIFALRPQTEARAFAYETLHAFGGRSVDGENPSTGVTRVGDDLYGLLQLGKRADADGVYRFGIGD